MLYVNFMNKAGKLIYIPIYKEFSEIRRKSQNVQLINEQNSSTGFYQKKVSKWPVNIYEGVQIISHLGNSNQTKIKHENTY